MRFSPVPLSGRILLVDDDPTIAEVVTGYLERAGYAVSHACDGPAALEYAAQRWPELMILDLMLPGMDGLEVCRELRARGPVPVVMLTARGEEDDRILGLEIVRGKVEDDPARPQLITTVWGMGYRCDIATTTTP